MMMETELFYWNQFNYRKPRHLHVSYLRAPILRANFFEKYEAKSKEQNSMKNRGKFGKKWVTENCNLASTRIVTNSNILYFWKNR